MSFLLFFSIQFTYSQQDKYNFEKFVTSQINYPISISCMLKDQKGFVWFGTSFGLYRFDGYNFKVYRFRFGDSTSLGNDLIYCLYDDDRYLWIGTTQGLNRFDKTTELFKEFTMSFLSNFIFEICPSTKNELWIGTGNGLYKFDKKSEAFSKFDIDISDSSDIKFSNAVISLYEDGFGDLWIGTQKNIIYKYNLLNKNLRGYELSYDEYNKPLRPDDFGNLGVSKISGDNMGNIWIATYNAGLNQFDKKTEIIKRFQKDSLNANSLISDNIITMTIDNDQKLWIGTPEGVSVFDPITSNFTNLKKEKNHSALSDISYIYSDDMGVIWICSIYKNGFSSFNKLRWKFNSYPENSDSTTNYSVFAVCEDKSGNYWVGTSRGIHILNKKKELVRLIKHDPKDTNSLSNNQIQYIYRDSKNFMWVGTSSGPLDRYDSNKDIFTHYYDFNGRPFSALEIIEDKKENLWLGLFQGGIRVFDKNRNLVKKYLDSTGNPSFPRQNPTLEMYEDSKENMWIGTLDGLVKIDLEADTSILYSYNPYTLKDPLFINLLSGINEDETGNLWLGSWNGINKFDINSKKFDRFTNLKDGGKDFVKGLMRDAKGNFWASTDRGVTKFDPDKKTFTDFGLNDGLDRIEFGIKTRHYKSQDGEMFFCGDGFNSFYPDSIPENNNIPVIALTDFRVFNKAIKLDTSIAEKKVITISYKENFFSFDYSSLDYTNPPKNQHAYMLEGIDEIWNNVGNVRTANYTDIEPGEYTFRVKGSNNDGLWNEKGVSVKLIITPPWWQSWWFKSCSGVLILLTVGYGYKKRINNLKRDKSTQEEFSRKLINSQEEERKKIASVLHDSIAHDVLITKNWSEFGLIKTEDKEEFKKILSKISEQSSLTLDELRRIQFNLHPYEVEKLGLTKAIKSIIDRVSKSTQIKFTIEEAVIDKIFSEENEIHLYRIIQESVNNIIKHSYATVAKIEINRTDQKVFIVISDNGKGFSLEKARKRSSMGLSGIAERVKLLNGNLGIESESGNGTILRISLPLTDIRS